MEFELSAPVAAGARLFDSLAMLPRHLLGEAYARGEIDEMWGIGTPPEGIAGLGPFRLKSHTPGQQLVLAHNPHYWKTDAEGTRLPYLDEIVFLFVPSEDAQAARFASGEIDVVDSLSAGNYAVLEADREQRGYALHDLGPGMAFDFLFFNLNPLQAEELPNVAARQKWFRKRGFRQAVSAAVDREAISRLVYQGRAVPIWSSVSPGNRRWFNDAVPHPPRSLERAKELLRSEGFSWREGRLVDAAGDPVGFTIVTNSTNQKRVEMMTIIQQDLIELGMDVRVAGLEFRALIERILSSHEYDVAILALGGGAADPSSMMNVLLSSGGSHLWSPAQSSPATPWEAEIDRLMNEQATTLDYAERAAKYDRVQEIIAEQLPLVPLVSPNVLTGASSDLGNMRPAVLEHYTLWNSEELFWKRPAAR